MDKLLSAAKSRRKEIIGLIQRMVECESPSGDDAALGRMADLIASELSGLARVKKLKAGQLLCDFDLPGKRKSGRILAIGHFDTVWPLGTLKEMPFRQKRGRLWGPGVLDMKSGVAFFICAMRFLRDLEIPCSRRVSMLLTTDEELGSDLSRGIIEREAANSDVVLVPEPGAGLEGHLKTARKGIGEYTVEILGKAAHSGIDFTAGASAVVEAAHQVARIAGFTNLRRGITVNPGVISGGTRSNVVAAQAKIVCDLRIARLKDAETVDEKFRQLTPRDPRCKIVVSGGLNRPPMERTPALAELFRTAQRLGRDLGVELGEAMTGGGSDGNFTAALGIPTLDGLGGVGQGAHASSESILVSRIPDRTALLAKLVAAL